MVYVALDANAGRKRWSHIGIFNPRQQGTLFHLLPLFDGQFDDAPLYLETHQALVRLNIS